MANEKFGRSFVLNVETQEGSTLVIKPPFTLEFDVTRNVLTSANVCSARVFNLNAHNRNQIRKNINDYGDQRLIRLQGGYGANLPLIFDGSITQAWSVREGVNFITQIESFDGGFAFANATSNFTAPAGATQKSVIESLIQDMAGYGVKLGSIGDFPGVLSRGNAYSGNTYDLLREMTGGRFFVDNGKAYVLADNECLEGTISTIDAAAGLLSTPVREQTIINFDMLFEPRLVIGQQIQLKSLTADSNINGNYKVISLKHRGIISEAVCGSAVTSVGLLQPLGTQSLVTV